MRWLLLLPAALAATVPERTVSYAGEQVLTCLSHAGTQEGMAHLDEALDVWAVRPDEVDIRVRDAEELQAVHKVFGSENCMVSIADVEALVATHEQELAAIPASAHNVSSDDWFTAYHDYAAIVGWYRNLVANNPIVTMGSIGQSFQSRDMPWIRVRGRGGPAAKPRIFFQCQIHAREWISSAVCMYVVNELVKGYGTDETITLLLDTLELIVVPFINPDGYSWTWTNARLWRKSRRPHQTRPTCIGIDLNRNYNDRWGGAGSSPDPCSDTYRGAAAASEPEVQNAARFFRENAPVFGGIDFHSYSQLILRPFSWTNQNSPHELRMRAIGDAMRDIIRGVSGFTYRSGKWFTDLYPSTGVASDWMYNDDTTRNNRGFRSPGYCLELRPSSAAGGGFILPPEQIIPNGREVFPAILHFMEDLSQGIPVSELATQ